MVCFGLLLDYLARIEHLFLGGIRDSRKTGSLWRMMRGVGGVRKSEHQSLLVKLRISWIRTVVHSLISVWELNTIIHEKLKMRKICAKFVQKVLREDQKERRSHDSREMVDLINSDPAVFFLCSGDLRWKLDLLLWPRDQEREFPLEACWLSQTQEGQTEQIHQQTFDDPFFWQHWHDLHALGSLWTVSQQGILCWGFKEVKEEIPSEEASTLSIRSVAFPLGQCTSPQLHPCHRLFDQNGHQDSSSPSLYSRPSSLWLSAIP